MPTIRRFDRFKICMYADDHLPPHFHMIGKGFAFVVLLNGLRVEAGRYPPGVHAEAIGWAAANLETLWAARENLNERG